MSKDLSMTTIKYILSFIEKHHNIVDFSLINKNIHVHYKQRLHNISGAYNIAKIIKYQFKKRVALRCVHMCDCWYETKRLCNQCKKNKIWYVVNHFDVM